jgi:Ca-activated chloride channel family protein
MKLDYVVNPYLPATRQRHLVYVLLQIDPGPEQAAAPAPLNLSLVVDASRSMSIPILNEAQFNDLKARGMAKLKTVDGVQVWQFEVPRGFRMDAPSNMDFTKEALRIVAEYLRPDDRFSLVAFAQDALLMVGSRPGTETAALQEAIERLDRIDLGDETFMARGMQAGYKQAMDGVAAEATSRMIVLTDGYTKEEHDCYTWSRQAKQDGIVVSTMGLGLDFNEELLISLADVSGGHAYFIEDPQEIPGAFRQELARAQSVTWRDLTVELEAPADVTLRRAHRVRPTIAPIEVQEKPANAQGIQLVLGDLEGAADDDEAGPAILLELIVPPRPAGTFRLAQVVLHGRPVGAGERQQLDQHDVLVRYTEKASQVGQQDAALMAAIQKVSAFKLQTQALQDAQQGNVAGATQRLRMAGERLIEMGEEDLGQTMLVEAELMEREGQMSAEGTKKLRYGTRKLR